MTCALETLVRAGQAGEHEGFVWVAVLLGDSVCVSRCQGEVLRGWCVQRVCGGVVVTECFAASVMAVSWGLFLSVSVRAFAGTYV